MKHQLAQILDGFPIEIHVCTCGRMFDATRIAVHIEREGAR